MELLDSVSILVVVECPSEFVWDSRQVVGRGRRFNPCCGGMSF